MKECEREHRQSGISISFYFSNRLFHLFHWTDNDPRIATIAANRFRTANTRTRKRRRPLAYRRWKRRVENGETHVSLIVANHGTSPGWNCISYQHTTRISARLASFRLNKPRPYPVLPCSPSTLVHVVRPFARNTPIFQDLSQEFYTAVALITVLQIIPTCRFRHSWGTRLKTREEGRERRRKRKKKRGS